jgi:hypothetical protein
MYVSTLDSGLWYVPDISAAGLSFSQTNYPFRQPERIFLNPFNTNEIWVASFGYGLSVGIVIAPPKVTSANFNYQTGQSVTLQFSADVSATLGDNDITLTNLPSNTTIAAHVASNGTSATITVPGNLPLSDGNYQLTISASGVSGAGGPLDGNADGIGGDDFVFGFFFLNADADHNRTVNTGDFNVLAQNFNKTGMSFGQGDFNYDGRVNALDFNVLATEYGKTVPSPAPPIPGLFSPLENRFTDDENAILA